MKFFFGDCNNDVMIGPSLSFAPGSTTSLAARLYRLLLFPQKINIFL